jgi:hypothetical protein
MDKIDIIKNRLNKSSTNKALIHFKDHVLEKVYENISVDDALTFTLTKLIDIKNSYIKNITTKQLRAYSLDYYLIRGWDINDAKDRISKLQRNNSLKFAKKRKSNPELYSHMKSPMTLDFWLDKGFSESEANDIIQSQRPCSIKYWLNKGYSEKDAKKLSTSHQKNAGLSFSKKYKEDPKKYDGFSNTQLKYWLNKGYSKEVTKEKLKERQTTFSLEKCIQKFGKEEGTRIFNERQERWKKSLQENFEREGDGRSPSSQFASSIIKELCNYLNIEIPQKEKWVKNKKTGNAYSYDFTYKKKIIEFNGDYWHCNPSIYEADYFNKNKEMTAKEIWEYDKEKLDTIKGHGYQVLTVWESDWKSNPKQTIEKCIQFIDN